MTTRIECLKNKGATMATRRASASRAQQRNRRSTPDHEDPALATPKRTSHEDLPSRSPENQATAHGAGTPRNEWTCFQTFLTRCGARGDWEKLDTDLLIELMTEPEFLSECSSLEQELIARLAASIRTQGRPGSGHR